MQQLDAKYYTLDGDVYAAVILNTTETGYIVRDVDNNLSDMNDTVYTSHREAQLAFNAACREKRKKYIELNA